MNEFKEFPKIARLSRECIITEKIDGTNAQITITEDGEFLTGSRSGWITPDKDNYGFAMWAYANKDDLMKLGKGTHFGEWWGSGIQRGYGLIKGDKRFSLFNTTRWCLVGQSPRLISKDPKTQEEKYQKVLPVCCGLVPELYRGIFDTVIINGALLTMKEQGSLAVKGYMNPEGIVVYHCSAGVGFKKTIEKDELSKWAR